MGLQLVIFIIHYSAWLINLDKTEAAINDFIIFFVDCYYFFQIKNTQKQ